MEKKNLPLIATKKIWDFFLGTLMPGFQNGYMVDTEKKEALETGYPVSYLKKARDYEGKEGFNKGHGKNLFDDMHKRMKKNQEIADDIARKQHEVMWI